MSRRSLTHLHEEVEVAEVVVTAGRGVAPHDVLAIDLGRDGDVLANGQPEHIFGVGERETVAARRRTDGIEYELTRVTVPLLGDGLNSHSGVGRDDNLLREGELLPDLGVEHRLPLYATAGGQASVMREAGRRGMPETRTAPAKLHVDERARKKSKRKRDELGVLAAEDVYHLCLRVDVVCRFLGEAVEDEVRDVNAPCVKLRLDELGEGEEQSKGANEGGNVGNLVAVGHGQRVAGVRPLWWGKTWAREGYANGMGRAALVLGPPRPFGALCTTLRTLRGCALYSSSIAADSS